VSKTPLPLKYIINCLLHALLLHASTNVGSYNTSKNLWFL